MYSNGCSRSEDQTLLRKQLRHAPVKVLTKSIVPLMQMAKNIDEVREYDVGQEFMRYILLHPEAKDEPEDYLFEEYDPEAE